MSNQERRFLPPFRKLRRRRESNRLRVEPLEPRLMLTGDPVLTLVEGQTAFEGAELVLDTLASFTDTVAGGGPTIGLNPGDFTSLGGFSPTEDVSIDTSNLEISGGFTGVGETVTVEGIEIAVFTFDTFSLDASLTLSATGSRPLALLSNGDLEIGGIVDVSAQGSTAGPGGGDGATDFATDGQAAAGAPDSGAGQGAPGDRGGSGGAFGGDGGTSNGPSGGLGTVGGVAYGDLQTVIQGGSGGASGGSNVGGILVGGGGGGGIELGATGTLTVLGTGLIKANGAHGATPGINRTAGGGGAGGGILLHADEVVASGELQADGGNAGNAIRAGGGGGGGRILVAHSSGFDDTGLTTSVQGGLRGSGPNSMAGDDGVVEVVESSGGTAETYEYSIDWGDGSDLDRGDVEDVSAGSPVTGRFGGAHTYADNDLYTVTVTLTDSGGGSASETFEVDVRNVDPSFGLSPLAAAAVRAEACGATVHSTASISANFRDPGFDNPAMGSEESFEESTIDWGDGHVSSGDDIDIEWTTGRAGEPTIGSISSEHDYAEGGIYTITVTIRDDDGGEAEFTSQVHVVGVSLNDGVLTIVGSGGRDHVYVMGNSRVIRVLGRFDIGSQDGSRVIQRFNARQVDRIHAELCDGNDRMSISRRVREPAVILAGGGDDTLVAGGGSAVLVGQDGNDLLIGGWRNDILIGGDGEDRLFGRFGNDLLIGGLTDIDNNDVALLDLLSQWSSTNDAQAARDALIGTFNVIDDGDEDILLGSWGSDWFLIFDGDQILDERANDLVDEL